MVQSIFEATIVYLDVRQNWNIEAFLLPPPFYILPPISRNTTCKPHCLEIRSHLMFARLGLYVSTQTF
jgi:hypothetical protein